MLGTQIAVLVLIVVIELRKDRDRNLIAIGVAATMFLLVQGQDWWVLTKLEGTPYIYQLNHLITADGARLANLYLTLFMGSFAIFYFAGSRRKPATPRLEAGNRLGDSLPTPYFLHATWVVLAVALLGGTLGGISQLFNQIGRINPGQASALIMLSMGKLPLFQAIGTSRRPTVYQLAAFALAMSLTLLSSRFLAMFMVLQLALIWNYRRAELRRAWLVTIALGLGLMLFGFGLFRDLVAYFPAGTPLDPTTIDRFQSQRTSEGVIGWFYQLNVEGFGGLAGILTFESLSGGMSHDYGLSSLGFVTQLIPNVWRTDPALPFNAVSQALDQAYPYHGSVVAPGVEVAYAHFGLAGIVALGALLGRLTRTVHERILSNGASWLLVILLSVQLFQVVRGTLVNVVIFGLGDIAILLIFRAMTSVEAGGSRPAVVAASSLSVTGNSLEGVRE